MPQSISSVVVLCLKQFSQLITSNLLLPYEQEVPYALWKDELGRMRVWAANIGAHQTGQSSLQYRLRDASHIREQILRLLQRLQRIHGDIKETIDTTARIEEPSDSDSDSDGDSETELQRIYRSLRETVNCLFQMSILIRRPAQHDRLLGTQRADTAHFEPFDRQHVFSKYPEADEGIVNRLGMAISQRRAILRYRERHHVKLAHGLDHALDDQPDTASTRISETVATEFVEQPAGSFNTDAGSTLSQTSYAVTLLQGENGMVIPPLPEGSAHGTPFQCPYCFCIISTANRRAWARHIFSDIMPYVCIFPNCVTPHRLYESRHEWWSHLQQQHLAGSETSSMASCALCTAQTALGEPMEKHLGRHLEELALFALPRPDSTEESDSVRSSQSKKPTAEAMDGQDIDVVEENSSDDAESVIFSTEGSRLGVGDLGTKAAAEEKVVPVHEGLMPDAQKAVEEEAKANQEVEEVAAAAATKATNAAENEAANADPRERRKHIKFKDAVGRKFIFPFDLSCTWEGMAELIREAFLHIEVLGPHVAEGHYDLIGPEGDIILPQVWDSVIEPGWTITMHMWPIPEKPSETAEGVAIPEAASRSNVVTAEDKHNSEGSKQPRTKAPNADAFAKWMARGSRRYKTLPKRAMRGARDSGEAASQATTENEAAGEQYPSQVGVEEQTAQEATDAKTDTEDSGWIRV